MAGTLNEVTDTNFHAEVIEAEGPVLVDFWAPWCGPCRVVAPVLEEIASERPDLRIVKLNIDENQQTAARFQVLSIPTMILFKGGAAGQDGRSAPTRRRSSRRSSSRLWPDVARRFARAPQGAVARRSAIDSPGRRPRSARDSPSAARRRARRRAVRPGAARRERLAGEVVAVGTRRPRSGPGSPVEASSIRSSTCRPAVLRAFCTAWTISRAWPSRRRSSSIARSSATAWAPSRSTL